MQANEQMDEQVAQYSTRLLVRNLNVVKYKGGGYSGRSSEPLVVYIFFRAESRGDWLLLKFLVEAPKNGHFFKILAQNLTKFQKKDHFWVLPVKILTRADLQQIQHRKLSI